MLQAMDPMTRLLQVNSKYDTLHKAAFLYCQQWLLVCWGHQLQFSHCFFAWSKAIWGRLAVQSRQMKVLGSLRSLLSRKLPLSLLQETTHLGQTWQDLTLPLNPLLVVELFSCRIPFKVSEVYKS